MGLFEHFPYSNFHEQNIDWLLRKMREQLDEMEDLYKQISEINTKIVDTVDDKLDGWVDDGTMAEIVNEQVFDELNDKINKLNTADFSDSKFLLIGDSYISGTGGISGRGWGYYFQQYTGATCDIIHQNGGGFAAVGNANATYPAKTYAGLVDSLLGTDYDYIIVQSGWNDASDGRNPEGASAVQSGVQAFITNITAKYPNTPVIILPTYNDTYPLNDKQVRLYMIAKTAARNGMRTCYDSMFWMQGSGYNASDDIHLNDYGYRQLAYYILSFMRGWSGGITFQKEITSQVELPTIAGVTLGANFRVYVDKAFCYACGDITLTEGFPTWTTLAENVPAPRYTQMTAAMQWDDEFKRPMRVAGTPSGLIQFRYGEAGNYRIFIMYPINLETD